MEDNVTSDNEDDRNDGNEPPSAGGDSDEEQFDISLPASHSYMGGSLVAMSGRSVLEAGWTGQVPVTAHHGTVFPGEIVPMLINNSYDSGVIMGAIKHNKLFGLLCPDETGTMVTGYGVLCEVFEASSMEEDAPRVVSFKARATHRFRCVQVPERPIPIHLFSRMRTVEVRVLPEVRLGEPLRHARLASLDALRLSASDVRLRSMDAAVTPWPPFVYDMFDYRRMRRIIREYFEPMSQVNLPEEAVSLSFWTASNLALSARDRLALFVVDDVLLRLHMEVRLITRKSMLCCAACAVVIARREHILAMSSEGVHSNYTNLSGYMHDIVTVSDVTNASPSGAASEEFSWFPGYAWTVTLCASCMSHVGWRFEARRRALRPQQFFALCRNYVQPRCDVSPGASPRASPAPPSYESRARAAGVLAAELRAVRRARAERRARAAAARDASPEEEIRPEDYGEAAPAANDSEDLPTVGDSASIDSLRAVDEELPFEDSDEPAPEAPPAAPEAPETPPAADYAPDESIDAHT